MCAGCVPVGSGCRECTRCARVCAMPAGPSLPPGIGARARRWTETVLSLRDGARTVQTLLSEGLTREQLRPRVVLRLEFTEECEADGLLGAEGGPRIPCLRGGCAPRAQLEAPSHVPPPGRPAPEHSAGRPLDG